jgi:hypothetical protein
MHNRPPTLGTRTVVRTLAKSIKCYSVMKGVKFPRAFKKPER